MSFSRSTRVKKARKNHACQYCQLPIIAGTSYYNEANVYDGDFSSYKLHPECKFTVYEFVKEDGEFYFSPFKVPRSEPWLHAMEHGDSELKAEMKINQEIEKKGK